MALDLAAYVAALRLTDAEESAGDPGLAHWQRSLGLTAVQLDRDLAIVRAAARVELRYAELSTACRFREVRVDDAPHKRDEAAHQLRKYREMRPELFDTRNPPRLLGPK